MLATASNGSVLSGNPTTQVAVSTSNSLRSGMTVLLVSKSSAASPQTTVIQQVGNPLTVSPAVTLTQGATYYLYSPQTTAPLVHAGGEQHVIAYSSVSGDTTTPFIGAIRLNHLPAPGTPISVRGISVTVRALWIQPRHGSAWQYGSDSYTTAYRQSERSEE